MARRIVIVGLMASGKTSVGLALAERLGLPHRDSDREIEATLGRTGRAIAARDGVPALHALEAAHLRDALADAGPVVISAAASIADDPELGRTLARAGAFVVWLDPSPTVLAARLRPDDHRRSLASHQVEGEDADEHELRAQRAARAPAFGALADLVIDDERATPDELAERIARHVERLDEGGDVAG